ncbi:hypothetical protein PGB90_009516 [Kerria lacca]
MRRRNEICYSLHVRKIPHIRDRTLYVSSTTEVLGNRWICRRCSRVYVDRDYYIKFGHCGCVVTEVKQVKFYSF